MDIIRALATTTHGCGMYPPPGSLAAGFSRVNLADVAPECKVQQIPAGEKVTARKNQCNSFVSTEEMNPNEVRSCFNHPFLFHFLVVFMYKK